MGSSIESLVAIKLLDEIESRLSSSSSSQCPIFQWFIMGMAPFQQHRRPAFSGSCLSMGINLSDVLSGEGTFCPHALAHATHIHNPSRWFNNLNVSFIFLFYSFVEVKKVVEIFTRMFHDPHPKVFSQFIETFVDFIIGHSCDLIDWFPTCLNRLLNKSGSDVLGNLQDKLVSALDALRFVDVSWSNFGFKARLFINIEPF